METIVILDAGAQYGKLIDRAVRELKVKTELLPLSTSAETVKAGNYRGIIISGGPNSVYAADAPAFDDNIFRLGIPVFGICYGMQLVNKSFGGSVQRKAEREDGQHDISVETDSRLFQGLEKTQLVLLTHGDSIHDVAPGFRTIARSGSIVAGIESEEKRIYAVQFHPEVRLSVNGRAMLRNFLFGICGCKGLYTIENREEKAVKEIQDIVGSKSVLVMVSGGVDSAVCAALLNKALGPKRVIALHIDNGFMRLNESKQVKVSLERLGLPLHVIDASEDFYNGTTTITRRDKSTYETMPLKEVTAPEEKRKIIGDTFIKVAERTMQSLGIKAEDVYLAQGTLRPDLIESASALASSAADAIKTHHNDTALVRRLRDQGKVVEPLKDYHKDEVRQLGAELGLAEDIVQRQPFPGPGLAIRVICAREPYMCADFDATQQLIQAMLGNPCSNAEQAAVADAAMTQADPDGKLRERAKDLSASLLPVQTVGVQGDGRTYSYVAALSSSGAPDWPLLLTMAKIIPRVCHRINRVVYMWGPPVGTAVRAITPTLLLPDVLDDLRAADAIVNRHLKENDLVTKIAQVPVVCVPVDPDAQGSGSQRRSIAIRTFLTADFMTGVPAAPGSDMPLEVLDTMVSEISALEHVARVMYDLTAKPPGTTEWE